MTREKSMTTDESQALVPQLRLPECGGKQWREKKIGDFLTESRIKGSSGDVARKLTVKLWGKGVIEKVETLGGSESTQYYRRTAGQFIYSKLDFLNQAFGVIPPELDGFESTVDLPCFDISQELHPKFLLEYVKRPAFYATFGEIADGGRKARRIQAESFLSFPLLVPPEFQEQLGIADCLSALDELIDAESQKLDALKSHKQGLMQQLFPRHGETAPHLRFPEFRSGPEWTTRLGGQLFANRKEAGEGGLPIYSVTMREGMVPRASFDRDFYDIEDPAGNRKVCKGDIAYNMMRMWQGAQGVAPEDCLVSPAYVVLAPQEGVCAEFFAYYFKLPQMLDLLTATSRGLTKDRLRLYFDDFARMRMCVPEFAEQQRIASCLASLDALIAAQVTKVEILTTHKQGLMQQLFPSPVEAER